MARFTHPGSVTYGIQILDAHETYADFIAEHPTGDAGDAHLVADHIYSWNSELNEWVDGGHIVGPAGIAGATGPQGAIGPAGPTGSTGATGGFGDYISVYDTTSQLGGSTRAMQYNVTDFYKGISIENNLSSKPTRITFTNLGKYNIVFSAQLIKTGGTGADVYFWLAHNGVTVPDSAGMVQIGSNNQALVVAWNYFVNVTSLPQYFELMWYTSDSNTSVGYVADAQTPNGVPAIPSIILTVNQIG